MPGNWGGTAPVAGDDLVFPANALNTTNTNDLPADTAFDSISLFPIPSYTVTGNAIVLGPGGLRIGGDVTFGLSVTLAADQTWMTRSGRGVPTTSPARFI